MGRRMIGYLGHYTPKKGKNAGKPREKIFEGSAKILKGPQPNKIIAPNVKREAPSEADQERAALIDRIEKQIGKAVTLNTPNHLTFVACDLQNAQEDELLMLLQTVKDEVKAALDD